MDASATSFPRAFAVRFRDFKRWDPASFQSVRWHWPKEQMAPIGSVLRLRKEKVDRAEFSFSQLKPITIHFDGSIDARKVDSSREYRMELYFARPGDIVVAKIDLKNGAVGIVPSGWQNVCVTGHFAVYEPDRLKLVPEYLHRVIQMRFFQAYLWRNKVGAEGRKEVKLDFFESALIPLPPLQTQQAIVRRWRAMQDSVEASKQNTTARLVRLDDHFLDALGLSASELPEAKKYLAMPWSQFRRWSVSYNEATSRLTSLSRGRYSVVELGSILEFVQYGTSEKANTSSDGTPILRMNNIIDGQLDFTRLKYIQLPEREHMKLLLRDGDILFNRTNSKELVGKCAVFHAKGEYVFASYLIRLRVIADQASPDFIAYAMNSSIGRLQIDALSRQIIGQANINTDELRSLRVPLPPLPIQSDIVRRIEEDRQKIYGEKENARKLQRRVEKEVEDMILGIRPVTDVREQSKESRR
jgi:type I restriction enzyme S subunit